MAEHIEREAAIAAAFSATSLGNSAFRDVHDTVSRLRLIPAADVQEVVLCRDCKYYNDETCDRWSDGTYLKPNDFCSRAARR